MSQLPILYSFRRCPYAMRARLGLLASGMKADVDYEHREVVLKNKPAEMLAVSPKGTVPVLVLPNEDGTVKVIDQSLDILRWALRQNDPYHWLVSEAEAMDLITQCDGDFKFHLDRYKYANRYAGANASEHRAKAAEFAQQVELHIQKQTERSYAFDSCSGIYYAGLMPFLRQFAHADKAWFAARAWPHLQSVLNGFESSEAFKTIMQTYAPFKAQLEN